ncbi:MAG: flagellar hook-length control protein FliK [Lachnospiraceae bacterium]|nr:flagellar hook-length control protein FliK [Lachnospiraceae bacterium]
MTILENIMQNLYANSERKSGRTPGEGTLPAKILQADAASKLLETLLQGETTLIKGTVLDLRQNTVLLRLTNGETLNARTETSLPLSIGDTAEFFIAGKDGKVVTLKLTGNENIEDAQVQKTVHKALDAAGIAHTEKAETVTRELMQHSQPINEANIRRFMTLSSKNPQIPVRDLVLMDIAKIPVTRENVRIYKDFGNSEPVAEFAASVSELSEEIAALPDSAQKDEFVKELKSIIKDMTGSDVSEPVSEEQEISVKHASSPSEASVEKKPSDLPSPDAVSQKTKSVENTPIAEKNATETLPEKPSDGQFSAPSDTPAPEKAIRKALHMPPKDFGDGDKVKKLYTKLEEASQRLRALEEKVLKQSEGIAKEDMAKNVVSSHTARLSSTLKFMDSINNIFPYVQLPVKLREENARGDLYVYEKKRAFKSGDTVSALLHLDLDNLGETDILIKLTGQNATVTISASSEASKEVFESEIPDLNKALTAKGYALNCEVGVREQKEENVPLLTQFLEAHSPSLVTRFSFDMRA